MNCIKQIVGRNEARQVTERSREDNADGRNHQNDDEQHAPGNDGHHIGAERGYKERQTRYQQGPQQQGRQNQERLIGKPACKEHEDSGLGKGQQDTDNGFADEQARHTNWRDEQCRQRPGGPFFCDEAAEAHHFDHEDHDGKHRQEAVAHGKLLPRQIRPDDFFVDVQIEWIATEGVTQFIEGQAEYSAQGIKILFRHIGGEVNRHGGIFTASNACDDFTGQDEASGIFEINDTLTQGFFAIYFGDCDVIARQKFDENIRYRWGIDRDCQVFLDIGRHEQVDHNVGY